MSDADDVIREAECVLARARLDLAGEEWCDALTELVAVLGLALEGQPSRLSLEDVGERTVRCGETMMAEIRVAKALLGYEAGGAV